MLVGPEDEAFGNNANQEASLAAANQKMRHLATMPTRKRSEPTIDKFIVACFKVSQGLKSL